MLVNIFFVKNTIKNSIILRYILFGGFATFISLFFLYVFVNFFHVWYLLSAIISFCVAVIVSYCLHKFFTFRNYMTKNIFLQFSSFIVYNLCMLGLNTLLMYVFVDIIGLWYLFSQFFISGCTAFVNYMVFNKIIFKNR
jgi:dolichol-phosphate mannosyltransferase